MKFSALSLAAIAVAAGSAAAFNVNCNSNYASYYGQNSAGSQQTLGTYCQDATEDVIVLSFMNGFPNILLNFANACETTFPGSTLLHCPSMAADIKYCQSQGKAVVLSMGGASGSYGFSSDAEGTAFADTVWNTFFKGTTTNRPFDDAVLDGIDLDIEGGSSTGYTAFINQLRTHYASDASKKYYIAAAPQCPYPDAYLGSVMSSAWFDMVFVQFYNNYCGLNAYPTWFNYNDWDNWAKTVSANKDVKIFIGAPGSSSAASTGYVNASTLQSIYNSVRSNYTSLGGIMTWDVSQARASGLASSIRSMLNSGGSCGSSGGSTTTLPSSTTSTTVITSTAAPITSTSTAAPITSTTSSAQPTSTSTGTCPVNGAGCTGNQQGCSGSSFALCNNGKWVLQSCASGTYCYLSGSTATCDWANGRPTTGCAISGTSLRKRQDLVKVNKITKPNLRPKPVKAAGNVATRVEFVVGDITDNTYTTALKISSLQSAFSGNWSISFTLPVGQTAESSSRGAVSISGNTVTIKSNPAAEKSKNMATTIKLVGTFTGDYVLPDSSSAKFTSN